MNPLSQVAGALSEDPSFVAGRLALLPREPRTVLLAETGAEEEVVDRLGCCLWPRPSTFAQDSSTIADYVGLDSHIVLRLFRTVDSLVTLAGDRRAVNLDNSDSLGTSTVATAAHRTYQEVPRFSRMGRTDTRADRLLASGMRGRTTTTDSLVAHAQALLPLAVVEVSQLGLETVRQWLIERGVPAMSGADVSVSGLLVAWRGRGLIFVDEHLPGEWKRLVIAHEIGHFERDHRAQREAIEADQPSLVDVYDGLRQATNLERIRVAHLDLSVRPITHRLNVDTPGGKDELTDTEDEATLFANDLLMPWEDAIAEAAEVLRNHPRSTDRRITLASVRSRLIGTFSVPADAANLRANELLGVLRPADPFTH